MGELKFIGKRVVNLIVMLLGVATLVFILTKMIPGDPVVADLDLMVLSVTHLLRWQEMLSV